MKKVRIGIVGMGRMGMTHYSIINTHPSVEIVSISDTSKVMLDLIKKYIPKLEIYTDYRNQLNSGNLDGIIVCTPSALHFDVCKMAGDKDIAVFCEKPFTTSPAQAYELADLFEKNKLVNQVGYVYRYDPVFQKAIDYVHNGLVGKLAHIKAEMYSSAITKPQSSKGWRSSRETGGGVTYEMGAHMFDLLYSFEGKPDSMFGTILRSVFSSGVEDIVSTNLVFCNGVTCSLFVDWSETSYRKPMMKFEFLGDKGKVMADLYGLKIFLNEPSPIHGLDRGWTTIPLTNLEANVPYYVRGNGFTTQLYEFADAILGNNDSSHRVFYCTFREAAETQEMIHQIFRNAQDGK